MGFSTRQRTGAPMSIPEQIAELAAALPAEQQREVLNFTKALKLRLLPKPSGRGERIPGLFAGQKYTMSKDFDALLPDSFWIG